MCLVGCFKIQPPDPQAFQSRLGFLDSLQIMDAVLTGDYFPTSWDSPSFSHTFNNGAPRETRTLKIWLLRPTRIPIPSSGQMLSFCGGNYSVSEMHLITYTFHPLPDQKELSCCQRWLGRPEPSYSVNLFLIVRITLASDAGTFGCGRW